MLIWFLLMKLLLYLTFPLRFFLVEQTAAEFSKLCACLFFHCTKIDISSILKPKYHRYDSNTVKKSDDGTMWLLLIRRRLVNRFKMFKIMLGFENAQYLNVEGVELLPVTYFKLETLSHRSYITVDGELLDSEVKTVEAKIVPKSLSILTK